MNRSDRTNHRKKQEQAVQPDGTEIVQAEVARAMDSEQRYRLIVDTAYEGIWLLDENYFTTFVNRRLADMLGYEQQEMIGKNHRFFFFEEDLPDLEEKVARRRLGIAEQYERRLKRRDAGVLWTHVSATPMIDKDGRFQGSFAMFTDISKRKQAEEALLASETKYRSIFENAVEGVFQSTPDGRLITVNPAMARIFGYPSGEDMLASVENIGRQIYTNAEDRRTFKKLLEDHGIAGGFEARFFRKDHTTLWGSLNVRAVKDKSGRVLFYEGTLEDITARKTAEEELKRSEEKYRNIFENAVMGIFQITPDGRYMSVNPALARIHGYASPEQMIASVADIAHQLYIDPTRRAQLKREIEERGSVNGFEIIMRKKDGSLNWVSISSHAVRDSKGKVLYYEGTLENITSRKVAEEELKQVKNVLDGTLRALSLAVETREESIAGHHRRVCDLATAIARKMDLPADVIENVRMAALVHDVGKMAVPIEILGKTAPLTEMEYDFVKTHARRGYDMLKQAGLPYPLPEIVLQHHERVNGSGYPQGLKGREMLLEALVLAVADAVEAMISRRPYRQGHTLEAAIDELRTNQDVLYEANTVRACVELLTDKTFRLK